jgi:hypothetical protein
VQLRLPVQRRTQTPRQGTPPTATSPRLREPMQPRVATPRLQPAASTLQSPVSVRRWLHQRLHRRRHCRHRRHRSAPSAREGCREGQGQPPAGTSPAPRAAQSPSRPPAPTKINASVYVRICAERAERLGAPGGQCRQRATPCPSRCRTPPARSAGAPSPPRLRSDRTTLPPDTRTRPQASASSDVREAGACAHHGDGPGRVLVRVPVGGAFG